MESFETRIVKPWKPSVLLSAVIISLLIGGALISFVFEVQNPWLKTIGWLAYTIGVIGGVSRFFIKPKTLGEREISTDNIKVVLGDVEENYSFSFLKEFGLNYTGYASFWKHVHGNKNCIYFTTNTGEKFDYEIVLENKQMKEDLKALLQQLKSNTNIKIEKSGAYSF